MNITVKSNTFDCSPLYKLNDAHVEYTELRHKTSQLIDDIICWAATVLRIDGSIKPDVCDSLVTELRQFKSDMSNLSPQECNGTVCGVLYKYNDEEV